jgi:hypothetical protein
MEVGQGPNWGCGAKEKKWWFYAVNWEWQEKKRERLILRPNINGCYLTSVCTSFVKHNYKNCYSFVTHYMNYLSKPRVEIVETGVQFVTIACKHIAIDRCLSFAIWMVPSFRKLNSHTLPSPVDCTETGLGALIRALLIMIYTGWYAGLPANGPMFLLSM